MKLCRKTFKELPCCCPNQNLIQNVFYISLIIIKSHWCFTNCQWIKKCKAKTIWARWNKADRLPKTSFAFPSEGYTGPPAQMHVGLMMHLRQHGFRVLPISILEVNVWNGKRSRLWLTGMDSGWKSEILHHNIQYPSCLEHSINLYFKQGWLYQKNMKVMKHTCCCLWVVTMRSGWGVSISASPTNVSVWKSAY